MFMVSTMVYVKLTSERNNIPRLFACRFVSYILRSDQKKMIRLAPAESAKINVPSGRLFTKGKKYYKDLSVPTHRVSPYRCL